MSKPIYPICVECNLSMHPHTNGVMMLLMAYSPPQPYEAYRGDLVECPKCGTQVISDGSLSDNIWRNGDTAPAPDTDKDDVYPVWEHVEDVPDTDSDIDFIVTIFNGTGGGVLGSFLLFVDAVKCIADYMGEERLANATYEEERLDGHPRTYKNTYTIDQDGLGCIYTFYITCLVKE